jgi:hypothetical protein
MTLIPGISALSPIIGQELDGQTFKAVSGQLVLNVNPASQIGVTSDANGLSFALPTVIPTTVTTATTGTGAARTLTVTVNGTSSTPIALPETNTLVIGGTPSAPTLAVTPGGTPIAFPMNSATDAGLVPARGSATATSYLAGDGTWQPLPAAPSTTNVLSADAVAKTITSTVNGVSSTISTAGINEEGTTLAFSAGTLQLKNAAGTVLSSSPIPDLDAQTLTVGGTPTAPTLAISGGNTITLPAGVTSVSNTVTGTGAARTFSTTVNGIVGADVPLPDTDAQTLTVGGTADAPTLAISGGNTVNLPAAPTCASINALFAPVATAPTATTSFLGSDCSAYKTIALTSAFGTPIGRIFAA